MSEAVNKCPFHAGYCSELIVNACSKQEELALKYDGKSSRSNLDNCSFSAGRAIYPEYYLGGHWIGIKCGECLCRMTDEDFATWNGICANQKEPGKWQVMKKDVSTTRTD